MFANLKKKIEEEVGDLSRLTSPINLVGALGDRRVGGSTQGTNTPNLGSRQSSVASLIDIGPDRPVGQSRPNAGQSSQSQRDVSNEELQQLKKVNVDLKSRLENLMKSYEEKLQNQEADFAWKYNSKEDELAQLRNERDRLKEQVKLAEVGWQEKYVRVATELENLEGLSKQENAKLLNTQNDLQSSLARIAQLESDVKNREDRKSVDLWLATEGYNNGGQLAPSGASSDVSDSVPKQALQDTNQEYLDKISELEGLNKDLSDKLRDLESTSSLVSNKYDNLAAEHSKTKDEFTAVQSELVSLQKSVFELKQQQQVQKSMEETRLNEIRSTHEILDSLKKDYAKSKQELDAAKLVISELKASTNFKDTEISSLKDENLELKVELEKTNEKNAIAEEQRRIVLEAEQTPEPSSDRIQLEKLTVDHEALTQRLSESLETVKILTTDKNDLAALVQNLRRDHQSEVDSLKAALSSTEEKDIMISKSENQISHLRESVNTLTAENTELQRVVEDLQKIRDERDSLVTLKKDLQGFRNDSVKIMKLSNNEIQSVQGDSIDDLKSFTRLVVEKIKIYNKLDEEMKAIKDEASREVSSLQCRTDELIEKAIRDLKETQAKLEDQTKKSNQLQEDLGRATQRASNLEKELEEASRQVDGESKQIQNLTTRVGELKKQAENYEAANKDLVSQINALKDGDLHQKAKLTDLSKELEQAQTKTVELEGELSKAQEEILFHQNQSSQEESANIAKLKKLLEEQKVNYEKKLGDLKKESQILHSELKSEKKMIEQQKQDHQSILKQLDQANTLKIQNEEEIRILMEKNREQSNEVLELKSSSANSHAENASLLTRVKELDGLLNKQVEDGERQVVEIQSEVDSLKDIVAKQELLVSDEANKHVKMRHDLDEAHSQLSDLKNQIMKLQDEKDLIDSQMEEMSVHKALAEDEAKTAMERSSDLYNEVTELKKSLKTNRQQLSELKKSLHKELKNDVNNSSVPNANPSTNVAHMEEVSLRDGHHGDANPPYSEVNFMYLRSVLFKYLTASDPQVAANLIRVVATLLELKPDEEKLLRETQESRSNWLNSLIKK